MTRIEFLHDAPDRIAAAAEWLRQAWRKRQPVLVYAPERRTAEQLDRLLWTQPATGFLPHCDAESSLASETPIVMTESLDRLPHDGCLLNLADELPPGFSRFSELVEIVSTADADRLPARERFKHYRERGYAIDARSIATGV
ncbi:MAG: DNA polymerase III subunit chi [Gammaproteobacteria bacterium]|nr:DNA polymerase III subunit chi [Gammaproteobacteria bacterium]MBU1415756.1 DNA polymerase III subunit chi [Gammaproteobacteria bacterium]